jgi:hypothetical protein
MYRNEFATEECGQVGGSATGRELNPQLRNQVRFPASACTDCVHMFVCIHTKLLIYYKHMLNHREIIVKIWVTSGHY